MVFLKQHTCKHEYEVSLTIEMEVQDGVHKKAVGTKYVCTNCNHSKADITFIK